MGVSPRGVKSGQLEGHPLGDGTALNGTVGNNPEDNASELSAKLNRLFDVMRKQSESPMSNPAAAAAITQQTGVSISATYLWQLRTGAKTNPTLQHLQAIAEFFGVSAYYLIEPGSHPHIDAQLNLIQALRDSGVRGLAMRAQGLTAESINSLAAMADQIRQLEQLPPVVDDDSAQEFRP